MHDYDFDAHGKHMSHVWERVDGSGALIVAKGALEGLLDHCAADPASRAQAIKANARLAASGMRVLAVAGRVSSSSSEFIGTRPQDERELKLYGLLGFHDPIRPAVPGAVAECQRAGIALKLVTGDHPLTAHAIADGAGIAHRDDTIITGPELDAAEPAHLCELVRQNSIFARTRPDQKYAIVRRTDQRGRDRCDDRRRRQRRPPRSGARTLASVWASERPRSHGPLLAWCSSRMISPRW